MKGEGCRVQGSGCMVAGPRDVVVTGKDVPSGTGQVTERESVSESE